MKNFFSHLYKNWLVYTVLCLISVIAYIVYLNYFGTDEITDEILSVEEIKPLDKNEQGTVHKENGINLFNVIILWYITIPLVLYTALTLLGMATASTLQNVPYEYDKEGNLIKGYRGWFTALVPGEVKLIERAGRFVAGIMNLPGWTFKGYKIDSDIPRRSPEYWEAVETKKGEQDASPVPFPRFKLGHENKFYNFLYLVYSTIFFVHKVLWWLCKFIIYKATGYVFTGIPFFQSVRVYLIEYYKETTSADGEYTLVRKVNYSDHYKIAKFDAFIPIGEVETLENIPITLMVHVVARIFNPWLAAYNTGATSWTTRVYSKIPGEVNEYTRSKPFDQIYTGDDRTLTQVVIPRLGKRLDEGSTEDPAFWDIGLTIEDVNIPSRKIVDISKLTPVQQKLIAVALAKIEARATIITAEGEAQATIIEAGANAQAVERISSILESGGENARIVNDIEGRIRLVEAGDKSTNLISIDTTRGAYGPNHSSSNSNDQKIPLLLTSIREEIKRRNKEELKNNDEKEPE